MLRTTSGVLLIAALLAACVTPSSQSPAQLSQPAPVLPRFDVAEMPDKGQARLYIFRPKFEDQALQHEQPVLRVGAATISPLPEATYVDLQLPPGRHTLSLAPPDGGSDLWRTSLTIQLRPNSIGYLALWMDAGYEPALANPDSAETVLIVLPVGDPAETTARLRVERVPASDAQSILRKCCSRVHP